MNTVLFSANKKETTMSSREIAELTGKQHGHVMRDVRNMFDDLNQELPHQSNQGLTIEYCEQTKRANNYIISEQLGNLLLQRYEGLLRLPVGLQERTALDTIEQLLGVSLERQYTVGTFRIDGYDPINNIAYEIDEDHHQYQRLADRGRQNWIEKELGCTFIRINV